MVYREHPLPSLGPGPVDMDSPLRLDLYIPPTASLIDQAQGIDVSIAHPQTAAHVNDASCGTGAGNQPTADRISYDRYGGFVEPSINYQ